MLQALVGHCEAWRANFTGLLNSIALKELQALHEYFVTNTAALRRPPTTLDMLAEAVQLHRKLTLDKPAIEARFEPLHDKYRTLEKFEVGLYIALPAEVLTVFCTHELASTNTKAHIVHCNALPLTLTSNQLLEGGQVDSASGQD